MPGKFLTQNLYTQSTVNLLPEEPSNDLNIDPQAAGACTFCGASFVVPWNNPCLTREEASNCYEFKKGRSLLFPSSFTIQ